MTTNHAAKSLRCGRTASLSLQIMRKREETSIFISQIVIQCCESIWISKAGKFLTVKKTKSIIPVQDQILNIGGRFRFWNLNMATIIGDHGGIHVHRNIHENQRVFVYFTGKACEHIHIAQSEVRHH